MTYAALFTDLKFVDVRDGVTLLVVLIVVATLALVTIRLLRTTERPGHLVGLTTAVVALVAAVTLGMYGKISNDAVTGIIGAALGLGSAGISARREAGEQPKIGTPDISPSIPLPAPADELQQQGSQEPLNP